MMTTKIANPGRDVTASITLVVTSLPGFVPSSQPFLLLPMLHASGVPLHS
ncbi:hypothetical protein LXM25_01715 [Dyadobacter sp. LJ53]|nr:hypothetical protein [Dyadobacter chenwenxiniae]MCF0048754.1 hypothetical protein [Dyadobacter chenwenxiniae]